MAQFILTCVDKPGVLELRMSVREAHLAYVRQHMALVKLAGPLLTESGDMAGSHYILEAENRAEVEAFTRGDPYTAAGVFQRVEIHPFRISVGALA